MKRTLSYVLIFLAGAIAAFFYIHHEGKNHKYAEMHESHHGNKLEKEHHGNLSHKHDEVNMPGLQGKDTTKREVSDLKEIFQSHKGINRVVTNLTDGIVTTTEAEDETLREAIVSHVSMMITRIEEGKNPEVMIQSPTLDKLLAFIMKLILKLNLQTQA
jgi:hypothetical protein